MPAPYRTRRGPAWDGLWRVDTAGLDTYNRPLP